MELGAYQCYAFLDWRFVEGDEWKAINDSLNGAGVESIQVKRDGTFTLKMGKENKEAARKSVTKKKVAGVIKKEKKKKETKSKKVKPASRKPAKAVKKMSVKVQAKIIKKSTVKKPGKNKVAGKNNINKKVAQKTPLKRKTVLPVNKKPGR